jgi:hypothetical protein
MNGLLQQLDQELSAVLDHPNAAAYKVALQINPNYVRDQDFRTMFLRADNLDPKRAAHRMIQFFDHKKALFGLEKLFQKITLADLDEDDRELLYGGSMQILNQTDKAGRVIICTIVTKELYENPKSLVSLICGSTDRSIVSFGFDLAGLGWAWVSSQVHHASLSFSIYIYGYLSNQQILCSLFVISFESSTTWR